MIKRLYIVLVSIIILGAITASLKSYFSLPIVAINSEGKCAYIETEGVRDYTCGNIPNKYLSEYVQ